MRSYRGARGLLVVAAAMVGGGAGASVARATPTKLKASTPVKGAVFGDSVAVSANDSVALVGADSGTAGKAGAAFIFTKNASGVWSQKKKLVPSDSAAGNVFGQAVALSSDGTTAVVSAPSASWGSGADDVGEVYIFSDASGSWTQIGRIESPGTTNSDGTWGEALAISSDASVIAVGDPNAGTEGQGAAYFYTGSSGSYAAAGGVTGSQTFANLGSAVAVSGSGNLIAVGQPNAYVSGTGYLPQVYTFTSSGSSFGYQADIASPDGTEDDGFGSGALGLNSTGTSILVGVPNIGEFEGEYVTGGAYLLTYASGSWGSPTLFSTAASGSDEICALGYSGTLSPNGDAILLGEPFGNGSGSEGDGAAVEWTESGGDWSSPTTYPSAGTGTHDDFGLSVALPSSDYGNPVIGAPDSTVSSLADAGAAYAY